MAGMSRRLLVFDAPDRFTPAAVGEPGHRSFYLQARQGGAVVTLGLEKIQMAALAERIGELLASEDPAAGQAGADGAGPTPLEPMTELFRVGMLAIGWDRSTLTIEARPIDEAGRYEESADDDPNGPDLVRVRLSPDQGVEFIRLANALVAAGRPACPFCGQPIDPTGHFCPASSAHLN